MPEDKKVASETKMSTKTALYYTSQRASKLTIFKPKVVLSLYKEYSVFQSFLIFSLQVFAKGIVRWCHVIQYQRNVKTENFGFWTYDNLHHDIQQGLPVKTAVWLKANRCWEEKGVNNKLREGLVIQTKRIAPRQLLGINRRQTEQALKDGTHQVNCVNKH